MRARRCRPTEAGTLLTLTTHPCAVRGAGADTNMYAEMVKLTHLFPDIF